MAKDEKKFFDTDDPNWWTPENHKIAEKNFLATKDFNKLDPRTDFGSYRRILLGDSIRSSQIELHNDLYPSKKIKFLSSLIDKKKTDCLDILDVGCGLGFTSEALSKVYQSSRITGVDLSKDAIKYAKKSFQNINFVCNAIEPSNETIGNFDIILAIEFYPFTRHGNLQAHKNYLKHLLNHLKKNGRLVICQKWDSSLSIAKNLTELNNNFREYKFFLTHMPHSKVLRFVSNKSIAQTIDKFLRLILKKQPTKVLIIRKK